MANLRADNLCGPDGRNAIDGSLFFDGSSKLSVPNSADVRLGSNDFTIEAWIKVGNAAGDWEAILGMWDSSNTRRTYTLQRKNSDGELYLYVSTDGGSTNWAFANGGNVTVGDWHHVAGVRDGNTLRVYLNGVEVDNSSYSGTIYNNTTDALFIGDVETTDTSNFNGYISNARLVNGTCLYPSGTTFTPPTEKLTVIPNTKLLCCQDSDDATQEATGKTITAYGGFRQDKTEGNLITNALDWDGAASSKSTDMPTNWTAGNGAEVEYDTGGTSGGGANRMLRLYNDGSNSYIYQTIPTVIGQKYQIDLWYEAENSSLAIKWSSGTSAAGTQNGSTQWNVGTNGDQATQTGSFQASSTTTYITFQIISGTDGASVFVDDIQVKAINPKAPKVLPPVGVDEGVTFEGDIKMNSQGYMYFPTGDTSQRGRGRALYGGGYKTPNSITAIDYLSIQSGGLTEEWGNLSTTQLASGAACSSSTRWVTAGGWTGANNNAIEYVTFTTSGNSLEFGDLVVGRRNTAAVSNSTRGIWGGGYISPADAGTDSMDYITIASTGNAADFGNLSAASKSGGVAGSTTRAVWALGLVAPADNNTLEYVTIATTGNVTNFGDMPSGSNGRDVSGCSSNVRGIYGGGQYPTEVNIINYITIATTGDAVDFGDLTLARGQTGATSNGIRGVFMGGTTNPARVDNIDSVIIATTGNAVNWGDFRTAKTGLNSAASDSHGGLS